MMIECFLRRRPGLRIRIEPVAKPPENAFNISIKHSDRLIECNAGDRRSRIAADARQLAQAFSSLRKDATKLPHNRLRGRVQIPRAMVISKPAPLREDCRQPGSSKVLYRRKLAYEVFVSGQHRGNASLLQHDF